VNTGIVEKIELVVLDALGAGIAVTRNHEQNNIDNNNYIIGDDNATTTTAVADDITTNNKIKIINTCIRVAY
jgi:hypothetical protein